MLYSSSTSCLAVLESRRTELNSHKQKGFLTTAHICMSKETVQIPNVASTPKVQATCTNGTQLIPNDHVPSPADVHVREATTTYCNLEQATLGKHHCKKSQFLTKNST